ncbi:hypothetical protein [Arthrobacter sp. D5-1]|uniref:hypothetical protein n=1 Tax=Arthrobacter sp. D5-1 TaxID=1477518 RepID=UPI001F604643|nr:hypothetical protein [Arthrobacter sp. D5-1]
MTGRLGSVDLNHEVARLIADRVREINPNAALLAAESTADAAPDFTGEHWPGAMTYSNLTRPLWSVARQGRPQHQLLWLAPNRAAQDRRRGLPRDAPGPRRGI